MEIQNCGLCLGDRLQTFYWDEKRNWLYLECEDCGFVFREPSTYLDPADEKVRYMTHNNSIENEGYVRFLTPALEALLPHLREGEKGLDFGSGPGPIMDPLFGRHGFHVDNYDPYFAPHTNLQPQSYNFIVCTEAFEHFYSPAKEMDLMVSLLRPGGHLLLMTQMNPGQETFPGWGYRTDNTHICFLNKQSLFWLAQNWGLEILQWDQRIFVLRKISGPST